MDANRNAFAADSQPAAHRRARGPIVNQSRVTNGDWLLPSLDMRSAGGRRFRDLCRELAKEIGGELSVIERAQVRAAAACLVRAEAMQDAIARGEVVSADDVVRLSSESRRILASIKAKVAKPAPGGDELDEYLKAKRGAAA
jgi:hypothetical protein